VKPVDYVVMAIVAIVGFVVAMPMMESLFSERAYDHDAAKIIASLVTSMIAIISIYVGAKLRDRDDE
jgi:hypothetical protein